MLSLNVEFYFHDYRNKHVQLKCISGRIFHFLPDYVMPYTIHLLAHDPELKEHDEVEPLKNIKE